MGLIVHVDGGSRGNPGPAGAGVRICSDDGTLLHEGAYYLGRQTSNAAEYHALIRALQRVERSGEKAVTVCCDSELLVRQVTGAYRVRNPKLAQLFQQVQLLLLKIPCWNIQHVPRELNRRADQLAGLAIEQQRDLIVFDVDGGADVESGLPPDLLSSHEPDGAGDAHPAVAAGEVPDTSEPGTRLSRAAHVTLARGPAADGCPAAACPVTSFTVESRLPVGLCLHAAHALLPTILAVLNTEPAEFAAVPTLTVRCMQPGCGATFHVSPVRPSNGDAPRDEAS